MTKHADGQDIRIEAGQILNPDCFPQPNELVCIQVQKVFDQVALRDCQSTRTALTTVAGTPSVTFEGVDNFDITSVRVISRTDALSRKGYKKLRLAVTVDYDIIYAVNTVTQPPIHTSVTYNLTVNEIYCPSCTTQIGVVRYPESRTTEDRDGTFIKVEAILEAFHDNILITSPDGINYTFTLTLDIGAFFVVKCECDVQLLIPAYGYCPVPPEQANNPSVMTCTTFNDRCRTPFPRVFFPEQKWNPLDNKRDDWEE